jgi:hypothetical protein
VRFVVEGAARMSAPFVPVSERRAGGVSILPKGRRRGGNAHAPLRRAAAVSRSGSRGDGLPAVRHGRLAARGRALAGTFDSHLSLGGSGRRPIGWTPASRFGFCRRTGARAAKPGAGWPPRRSSARATGSVCCAPDTPAWARPRERRRPAATSPPTRAIRPPNRSADRQPLRSCARGLLDPGRGNGWEGVRRTSCPRKGRRRSRVRVSQLRGRPAT